MGGTRADNPRGITRAPRLGTRTEHVLPQIGRVWPVSAQRIPSQKAGTVLAYNMVTVMDMVIMASKDRRGGARWSTNRTRAFKCGSKNIEIDS